MTFEEWKKDSFRISTDPQSLDLDVIHGFLSQSYWAKDVPLNVVKKSIEGSLCFGVYETGRQIGFARVISDRAIFAYLADVFIIETYRGRGLSKWLMECIFSHSELQGLRRWMLATRDAHGLYEKFGFQKLPSPERYMAIVQPNIYQLAREKEV